MIVFSVQTKSETEISVDETHLFLYLAKKKINYFENSKNFHELKFLITLKNEFARKNQIQIH